MPTASPFPSHFVAMHDALRQRLLRRIESLPEEQVYQVLDYIEFLDAKYAATPSDQATGLQKFAENLEDKLRRKAVSPATIREAFQLISAADRVLSGVSSAGKQILSELGEALEGPAEPRAGRAPSGPAEPGPGKAPNRPAEGPAARSSRPSRPAGTGGSEDPPDSR